MKTLSINHLVLFFIIAVTIIGCTNYVEDEDSDYEKEFENNHDTWHSDVVKVVKSIKLDDVKSLDAEIVMGVGILKLTGGAKELAKVGFAYDIPNWKPELKYDINNDRGWLSIKQPDNKDIHIEGKPTYAWNIRLNNDISTDLDITLGAGSGKIFLSELNLKYLHLTIGVGKSEIDLKGNWDHDVDIEIDGGIGVTTLYLPEDVGVRVKVKRGFGKVNSKRLRKRKNIYTNKAYDSSDVTINIKINAGIGAINLK
jgi:hypothetical protein